MSSRDEWSKEYYSKYKKPETVMDVAIKKEFGLIEAKPVERVCNLCKKPKIMTGTVNNIKHRRFCDYCKRYALVAEGGDNFYY